MLGDLSTSERGGVPIGTLGRVIVGCVVLCVSTLGVVAPATATLPGTNGLIAFDSSVGEGSQVFSMGSDGSNVADLTLDPNHDNVRPAWSPGGTELVFSSNRDGDGEIYTMNANGSGVTQLTFNTAYDTDPTWSPDGSKIAYSGFTGTAFDIYVINADGTGSAVNITNTATNDQQPAWSPDGTKIAFATSRDTNYEIYSMDANGSNPTNLTNNANADYDPAWSPDGSKIAFWTHRDGNDEVYSMDANGSNPTDLTNNAASDRQPAWSPDGTKIAFATNRTLSAYEIYSMDANGTNPAQLTFNAGGAGKGNPDWQTAGSSGPTFQPDAQIKRSAQAGYVGSDIYNLTGSNQTVTAKVAGGSNTTFDVRVQNDADAVDSIAVKGPGNKTGFVVHYYAGLTGTTAITTKVVAGTYLLKNLDTGAARAFRLVIHTKAGVAIGTIKSWLVTATSSTDTTKADAVKAKIDVTA